MILMFPGPRIHEVNGPGLLAVDHVSRRPHCGNSSGSKHDAKPGEVYFALREIQFSNKFSFYLCMHLDRFE